MGQNSSKGSVWNIGSFRQGYRVILNDKESNSSVVKINNQELYYLVRILNLTSQQDYENLMEKCRNRKELTSHSHEHYLGLADYESKVESTFCSSMYRVTLVYQYSIHSLQQEVEARFTEGRPFDQKQIWSLLCSCTLALAFLHRNNIYPDVITSQDILLTTQGIVKLLDPEARLSAAENTNFLALRRNRYYSPESLMSRLDCDYDNKKCGVFSLGMCLMEVMFLEPINDCYDYDEAILKQNVFDQKLNKLKELNYSPVLQNLLEKMLKVNHKKRLGVTQLEQYLFKLVQDNELSEHSGIRAASTPSHDISGIVEQKSIKQEDEEEMEKDIISQKAETLEPEAEELSNAAAEQGHFDMEHHDEDDQDGQTTQRGKVIPLSETTNFHKNQNAMKELKEGLNNYRLAESKQVTGKKNKENLDENSMKVNTFNQLHTVEEKLPKYPIITQTVTLHTESNQQLFTDPKLLAMLRNDVQAISMKRSKNMTSTYQTSTILNSINHQMDRSSSSIHGVTNVKTSLIDRKQKHVHWEEEGQFDTFDRSRHMDMNNSGNEMSHRPIVNQESSRLSSGNVTKMQQFDKQSSSVSFTSDQFSKVKEKEVEYFNSFRKPPEEQLTFVNESYSRGRYEGFKLKNLRHGFGTFYYKEGGRYAGYWKDNKMHGKGTLYYPSNKIAYDGDWQNDNMWGHGILYNEQPKELLTSYDYKCWDDVDDYWIKYEGDFMDDKSGFGKLYLTNGERFQGNFEKDDVNGQGNFYRRDGKVIRGLWKDNCLVKIY